MTDATLLAKVRKALNEEWKILTPYIRDGSAYTHLRDQHTAAMSSLSILVERYGQAPSPVQQSSLLGE